MPHCAICDAEVEMFGDDCKKCKDAVEAALDDYDVEQNEGIQIGGIVMPLEKAPPQEEE